MNLLFLPGAADPNHKEAKVSTNLIVKEAKRKKINHIVVCTYPGHKTHYLKGELDVESTKKEIRNQLTTFEDLKQPYRIFVRSYGCNVLLDILANDDIEYKFINKIIVWGASSFHFIYEGATKYLDHYISEGKKRGVKMSKNIFHKTFPVENYLTEKLKYKVVFCSGAEDKYSPQLFYNYLKELNSSSNNHFHDLIKNEKHTINTHNEEYLNLIFN